MSYTLLYKHVTDISGKLCSMNLYDTNNMLPSGNTKMKY